MKYKEHKKVVLCNLNEIIKFQYKIVVIANKI